MYAVLVTRVAETLPSTTVGRHVARQLVRCGTSAAANQAEAQSGESRKDFIHKLKLSLKEVRETTVWLKLLAELGIGDPTLVSSGLSESDELAAILYRSIETAKRNARAKN